MAVAECRLHSVGLHIDRICVSRYATTPRGHGENGGTGRDAAIRWPSTLLTIDGQLAARERRSSRHQRPLVAANSKLVATSVVATGLAPDEWRHAGASLHSRHSRLLVLVLLLLPIFAGALIEFSCATCFSHGGPNM